MKHYVFAACTLLVAEAALSDNQGFKPTCDQITVSHANEYRGKWQVAWTYRVAPGKYATSSAISRISGAPGVCGIREYFEGTKQGTTENTTSEPYFYEWTTTSLLAEKREAIWLDSAHGGFLHYTSVEGNAQWPIRFVWHHKNGRLKTRFQYSAIENGGFTIERHLSSDNGQSWALTSNAAYTPYTASAANHSALKKDQS